jgi:hypothetical protein
MMCQGLNRGRALRVLSSFQSVQEPRHSVDHPTELKPVISEDLADEIKALPDPEEVEAGLQAPTPRAHATRQAHGTGGLLHDVDPSAQAEEEDADSEGGEEDDTDEIQGVDSQLENTSPAVTTPAVMAPAHLPTRAPAQGESDDEDDFSTVLTRIASHRRKEVALLEDSDDEDQVRCNGYLYRNVAQSCCFSFLL